MPQCLSSGSTDLDFVASDSAPSPAVIHAAQLDRTMKPFINPPAFVKPLNVKVNPPPACARYGHAESTPPPRAPAAAAPRSTRFAPPAPLSPPRRCPAGRRRVWTSTRVWVWARPRMVPSGTESRAGRGRSQWPSWNQRLFAFRASLGVRGLDFHLGT